MKRIKLLIPIVIVLFLVTTSMAGVASPVVRAALFYSPRCPHCHKVISELLLPMEDQYGEQLEIVAINVDVPVGMAIFEAYMVHYQAEGGWPALLVADLVLHGSAEIPAKFPEIVAEGLNAGGIDWPDMPELNAAIESENWRENIYGQALVPLRESLGPDSSREDETTLARISMFGLLMAVGFSMVRVGPLSKDLFDLERKPMRLPSGWIAPAIISIGIGIAGYLTLVHFSHSDVVCGSFGDCEFVQSSEYAYIFGVPVALLGMANILAIGALWFGQMNTNPKIANTSLACIFMLTGLGTLFSIYLTYIEIGVLNAICLWCLASAGVYTALLTVLAVQIPQVCAPRWTTRRHGRRGRR